MTPIDVLLCVVVLGLGVWLLLVLRSRQHTAAELAQTQAALDESREQARELRKSLRGYQARSPGVIQWEATQALLAAAVQAPPLGVTAPFRAFGDAPRLEAHPDCLHRTHMGDVITPEGDQSASEGADIAIHDNSPIPDVDGRSVPERRRITAISMMPDEVERRIKDYDTVRAYTNREAATASHKLHTQAEYEARCFFATEEGQRTVRRHVAEQYILSLGADWAENAEGYETAVLTAMDKLMSQDELDAARADLFLARVRHTIDTALADRAKGYQPYAWTPAMAEAIRQKPQG